MARIYFLIKNTCGLWTKSSSEKHFPFSASESFSLYHRLVIFQCFYCGTVSGSLINL
jgi:hypothetical protein